MDTTQEHLDETTRAAATRAARRRRGVVIAARTPDQTAYAGAGDTGHGAAPDEDTHFEIGSITKTFTALALADAVVRGEVALDQPVKELLPGVDVPTKSGSVVTLAHLATHTSGLPRVPLSGLAPWRDYFAGRDPYTAVKPDELLHRLERARLKREPGSPKIAYSNFGFAVLGEALRRHTGFPDYASLIETRVCAPLGLASTYATVPAEQESSLAIGHRSRGRTADRWLLTGIAGAGVLVSTARDLMTYLAAHLTPEATPLAEAIALTQQPQISGKQGIGLGWMINPGKDGPLLWHNGGTGGYRSFAAFEPKERHAVVVLTNQNRGVDLVGFRQLAALSSAPSEKPG